MSEPGWAAFLGEHRADETPSERASRLARQAAQRDDREAELAEAERAAALQERHELQQVAAMHAGVAGRSAADVFADAGRLGDEDALYADAQKTIARIDRNRARRQQEMAERARQMAEVTSLASRSATITGGEDMLAGAKQAHAEYVRASRAAWSAATAGTPRREPRPFASRGGELVRSELECVHCVQNNVSHEASVLLHSDPEFAVPVTTAEDLRAEQEQHAERRAPGRYREIVR